MTDPCPLSDDELDAQNADLLPPREALTLLDTSTLGAAYGPPIADTSPHAGGGTPAGPGAGTATDSAGTASKLTDGTANPVTGYSPTQSASAS
jgi:hypothetical protein